MHSTTRAAALATAAVTVVALAACASADAAPTADPAATPTVATATESPAPSPSAAPAPSAFGTAAMVEYVDRFANDAESSTDTVWLDGAGVEAEFREAAAAFPLPLPDGYTWPTTTSRSYGTTAQWERGTGVVEAYFFWEGAHATAAYADHRLGDAAGASAHLEALVSGYASPVRSMYVDPEQPGTDSGYYRSVIEPAMQGDYWPLIKAQVEPFIGNDAYQAIAAQAGDDLDLGTEGFDAGPASP